KIKEELSDKKGMSVCYNNIGGIHYYQGSYDKIHPVKRDSLFNRAIEYYLKSLKIKEELSDKKGMSSCYNNIGAVHYEQGSYDKAIEYFLKSLKIYEELGNKNGIALVYGNIASLNIILSDSAALTENQRIKYLNKAVEYGNKAYTLALEIGAVPMQNDAAAHLQNAYKKLGNFKKAMEYADIFIETKDTMFSEEKTKALAEMNVRYEAEKKQLQIEKMETQKNLDNKTIEAQQAENRKQQIIIFSAIAGFLIVLVFSIIILRMFRQKRKANMLLAQQNEEIKQQKEEILTQRDEISAQRDTVIEQRDHIEEQKKDIEDSIIYAKRIQTAVLPSVKYANSIMGEHFIIFRPHSVVSGDFYWATKTEEWMVITVADCTGHGVPGAFMSMLGISFLNEIVRKKDVTNSADVLNNLRESIIEALKQTGEQGTQLTADAVKDGMDMSIIAIHKDRKRALWAGAHNPLWIIRQNCDLDVFDDKADMIESIKGDSMPVAIHVIMNDFTNHEIELHKGDKLYLFSDGFPDQFGGPKGKKFKYKAFKKLIAETSVLTMKEQGERLENELDNWMNYEGQKYEQIDDVTVVGIKI
ncbi:MAG: tetratricopeptide repeat protein, partial [Bacteroidales bacterium]|nr:tetratricopeptide repeat protein [Bacteroidales bacterium]